MRLVAQAILLSFTGYLPVAYAFLKLQAITGNGVANGCSKEQLSHLIESVRQASEAAHNTASTLRSARDHSFAVEILLGGQHYDDASTKETFAAAITNHVINVAVALSQTLGIASELSPHKGVLNFACPLEQEHPIVVESGTSGISNILNLGPHFFKMSSKSIVDKQAYDAAKKTSTNSRIFAQMPPFTSAPFHILRMLPKSAIFHSLPVPAIPLSLHMLAGHSLQPDGFASICILKQLDEEPFVPCNPIGAETTRTELPTCPSMGTLAVRKRAPGEPRKTLAQLQADERNARKRAWAEARAKADAVRAGAAAKAVKAEAKAEAAAKAKAEGKSAPTKSILGKFNLFGGQRAKPTQPQTPASDASSSHASSSSTGGIYEDVPDKGVSNSQATLINQRRSARVVGRLMRRRGSQRSTTNVNLFI